MVVLERAILVNMEKGYENIDSIEQKLKSELLTSAKQCMLVIPT